MGYLETLMVEVGRIYAGGSGTQHRCTGKIGKSARTKSGERGGWRAQGKGEVPVTPAPQKRPPAYENDADSKGMSRARMSRARGVSAGLPSTVRDAGVLRCVWVFLGKTGPEVTPSIPPQPPTLL